MHGLQMKASLRRRFLCAVKGKNGEERVTIIFVTVGSFVGSFWPF